jgi:hypothetical protein
MVPSALVNDCRVTPPGISRPNGHGGCGKIRPSVAGSRARIRRPVTGTGGMADLLMAGRRLPPCGSSPNASLWHSPLAYLAPWRCNPKRPSPGESVSDTRTAPDYGAQATPVRSARASSRPRFATHRRTAISSACGPSGSVGLMSALAMAHNFIGRMAVSASSDRARPSAAFASIMAERSSPDGAAIRFRATATASHLA